jgi:hypothetical protein
VQFGCNVACESIRCDRISLQGDQPTAVESAIGESLCHHTTQPQINPSFIDRIMLSHISQTQGDTVAPATTLSCETAQPFRRGLAGADLSGADLSGGGLLLCMLRRAVFSGATFKKCKLPMDLEGIDFTGCDLSGCDFRGRNIKEATFVGATLTDCDLSTCINAEYVDFSSCIGIDGARLPANNIAFEDHMNEWLGRQKGRGVRLELLYRASRDGFKAADFHGLCDNKGATVTVIRSKEGYVFGGYADQSWDCSKGWDASPSAFLFSLVRPSSSVAVKLPLNGTANYMAMRYDSLCGPLFGSGHDIFVKDSANTNSNSFTNLGGSYKLPDGIKAGTTFFTGARNFQASEVEVYQVIG